MPAGLFDDMTPECEQLLPGAGSAMLCSRALTPDVAENVHAELLNVVPWEQHHLQLFGRTIAQPRLVAWFGDSSGTYTYSGLTLPPHPWPSAMAPLRVICEQLAGTSFDSALANLYRDGRDSMAWHADDEPELGPDPVIASLSLGAERRFDLRNKHTGETVKRLLPAGSVVVMSGGCQHNWLHQVPKMLRVTSPRVNITFRKLLS